MSQASAPKLYDILIVGAGPTGLFGAFYAGMRELSCLVLDVLPQAGGQITALYPEKQIYDTPGFASILGKDLVKNLVQQASRWDTAFALGEQAQSLKAAPLGDGQQGWAIATDKEEYLGRAVVISAGIGAFRPVKLANDSIERFEGRGVEYFVTDLDAYAGKNVLVVGGGDSAVDWALAAEPIAKRVTLIHRREGFRAHDASVNRLNASRVDVRLFYELRELQGDDRLQRAVIFDNRTDHDQTLEVESAILALGFKADLGPIREWGLDTIGRRYIKVNSKMETNLPGVYAAGDIALQEELDPLNLIVTGYGQVTVAVNYAYARIKPGGKVFPGHSSEKMAGT
jgi:thioredoxin reductase (NADPH)